MNVSHTLDNSNTSDRSVTSLIVDGVDLYVPPILVIVGLMCNILVILVMRTSFFAHISTSLYITINACVDNLSLTIALPVHWVHVIFPDVIYRGQNRDVICQMINFIGWSTSDLGIVLTAAMTFERAFAIKYPLKAPSYCTVQKAKYVILVLFFVVLIKDGFMLFKSVMVDMEVGSHLCTFNLDDHSFRFFVEKVFPVIHNVVLVLSFLVICISNIIIITSVKRSGTFPSYPSQNGSETRRNGSDTRRNGNETHRNGTTTRATMRRASRLSNFKGRQLTIMLISDSLTIVICTLPFAIFTTIQPYITTMDPDTDHLIFAVTFYLLYINRCANFFLYCTSGEKFRLALRNLFMKKEKRRMSVFAIQLGVGNSPSSTSRGSDTTERQCL